MYFQFTATALSKRDMAAAAVGDLESKEKSEALLLAAARWGRADEVVKLLNDGFSVNCRHPAAIMFGYEKTPLHCAAAEGRDEVVRILLAAGADKDAVDTKGYTALMNSAESPATGPYTKPEAHVRIVRMLLDANANVNLANEEGMTALWKASAVSGHAEVVRMLLRAGADHGLCAMHGWSAIGSACSNKLSCDPVGVVRALLDAGADKDHADEAKRTPLHNAASNGMLELVKLLCAAGADKNAVDAFGKKPIDLVCDKKAESKAEIEALLAS